MFVMFLLLIVCTIIPWRLAFAGENYNWEITYYIIDSIFFVDIILTFHTTISGLYGVEIDDKKMIADNYLKGWFWIDSLSIIPFDTIMKAFSAFGSSDSGHYNSLIRTVKLTKIYKLIRLMRLMKLFKMLKNK
jgi:hypothetical protein